MRPPNRLLCVGCAGVAAVALSLGAACAKPTEQSAAPSASLTVPPPPEGGFTFDPVVESATRVEAVVTGSTNLPDGVVVSVTVGRPEQVRGDSQIRQGSLGAADGVVLAGRFRVVTGLDESNTTVAAEGPGGDVVEKISPNLAVCASVKTGLDTGRQTQPPPVRDVIGERGEAFVGHPLAFQFGSRTKAPSTWLKAELAAVPVPPPVEALASLQGVAPIVVDLPGFC